MLVDVKVDPRVKVREASRLLILPRVIYVRSFTEGSAQAFRRQFSAAHRTGQPIIPVVIDSFGGEVYSLLSMVDTIQGAKVPVATIIEGKAMSCGAVLFTCGTDGYRFIAPNATMMIHDVATSASYKKTRELAVDAKETSRLNRKLYRLIDRNCGHKFGYTSSLVQERGRADWYLTPKEAVDLNIANYIGIPSLETTVRISTKLIF